MSIGARIGVAIAALAATAGMYAAIRPRNDGPASTSTTAPLTATTPTATTPAVRVARATVRVGSDGPVGSVADVSAQAGERVVIVVTSSGFAGEVHFHGYDIHRDVAPGRPATFILSPEQTAQPEGQGVFEMELEATSTPIARVRISP